VQEAVCASSFRTLVVEDGQADSFVDGEERLVAPLDQTDDLDLVPAVGELLGEVEAGARHAAVAEEVFEEQVDACLRGVAGAPPSGSGVRSRPRYRKFRHADLFPCGGRSPAS